tara:strand:+ start:915 stop:1319 length:405 start_codon:yes stop_codon:yes gene_type:complete
MPIGLDASLPLRSSPSYGYYVLTVTIKENVKQKLKMLLYTAPGERVMIPKYGVGVKRYLFENANEIEYLLVEKIKDQVSKYLPEITILELKVSKDNKRLIASTGQKNTLLVQLKYKIQGTSLIDTMQLVETKLN